MAEVVLRNGAVSKGLPEFKEREFEKEREGRKNNDDEKERKGNSFGSDVLDLQKCPCFRLDCRSLKGLFGI